MAKKLSAFEQQFAKARAAGGKQFSFGGKSYSTKVAGGTKKKPFANVPKPGPATKQKPFANVPKPGPATSKKPGKMISAGTVEQTAQRTGTGNVPPQNKNYKGLKKTTTVTPTPRPAAKGEAPRPGLSGRPGMFGRGTGPKAAAASVPASKKPATTTVTPTPRPTPKGEAPRPGLSGLPGMFGRGIGPGRDKSVLPSATAVKPASRQGAEIQRLAEYNRKHPQQADPALVARVAAAPDVVPEYDTAVGVHRGTRGAPMPQSSRAAQAAADRARNRGFAQADVPRPNRPTARIGKGPIGAAGPAQPASFYGSSLVPPKKVKTTRVAATKAGQGRVAKSRTVVSSGDNNQHDYSRLKFFK
jgi:hypothetical protein